MRKLTDIQLSRVLSCAADGKLGQVGAPPTNISFYEHRGQNACLIQAALATWEGYSAIAEFPKRYHDHAEWFDLIIYIYNTSIVEDPDKLLEKLEQVGIA